MRSGAPLLSIAIATCTAGVAPSAFAEPTEAPRSAPDPESNHVKLRLAFPYTALGVRGKMLFTGFGFGVSRISWGVALAIEVPRLRYTFVEVGTQYMMFMGFTVHVRLGLAPTISDRRGKDGKGWLLQAGGALGYRHLPYRCDACDGEDVAEISEILFTEGDLEGTYWIAPHFGLNLHLSLVLGVPVAREEGACWNDDGYGFGEDADTTWLGYAAFDLGFAF